MLLYAPHCGGATNGDARIELLTVLMELSKAITERLPGGYGDVQIELLMEAMAELMMEIPRYNLDFVGGIGMEVILFPIKVPAPGQKRGWEFGWANNMSGA